MAFTDHDYWDRIWNSLPSLRKTYIEAFFIWLLDQPELLKSWAGVDVMNGKIHRKIEDKEIWEDSSETIKDYEELKRYIKPIKNRLKIKFLLKKFG